MNNDSRINWNTFLKYLLGGGGAGLAIGSGVSLANYYKGLKERADSRRDTSYDDDTIYIDLPSTKQANNIPTSGLSMLGALLAGILAYNGTRGLYQKEKRKQLQAELDSAQRNYFMDAIDSSQALKQASTLLPGGDPDRGGFLSDVGGGALAVLLLTMLGTGVATNKILDKTFPSVQTKPEQKRPTRIVLRTASGNNVDPTLPGYDKSASEKEEDVSAEIVEHLLLTILSDEKRASESGFNDLVHAVAQGRSQEILDNIEYGADTVLDLVKGASENKISNLDRSIAISWLSYDPTVSEAFKPLIAAEFYDMSPTFSKIARFIDEEDHNDLLGILESIVLERRQNVFAKVASMIEVEDEEFEKAAKLPLMDVLLKNVVLADYLKRLSAGPPQKAVSVPVPSTNVDGVIKGEDGEEIEIIAESDEAKQFLNKHRDIIDSVLGA